MNNYIQYKGYVGSIEYAEKDEVFHGRLMFIRSLVAYESSTAKGIKKSFYEAVDDYLKDCKADGVEPEKPCKGQFNVRIKPELHRQASVYAIEHETSLNAVVGEALEEYLLSS